MEQLTLENALTVCCTQVSVAVLNFESRLCDYVNEHGGIINTSRCPIDAYMWSGIKNTPVRRVLVSAVMGCEKGRVYIHALPKDDLRVWNRFAEIEDSPCWYRICDDEKLIVVPTIESLTEGLKKIEE